MIQNTIKGILDNLKYIVSDEDSIDDKYLKIIDKLKDDDVNILTDYSICEFKDNFSKVLIKLKLVKNDEEISFDSEIIIKNENFLFEIQEAVSFVEKKTILKLFNITYVVLKNIDVNKFNTTKEQRITEKQLYYLRDKMNDKRFEKIIENSLEEFEVFKIEELTRKQASSILDKIQKR